MPSERQIRVGGVAIGGGAPVAVQTMTKTETADLRATMDQIRRVADAGADLVRVAVPREQDAEALKTIVRDSPIPVIADIHFNYTLALKALDAGAHCVRLNPGNIGGPDKVAQVTQRAAELGTPLRIGVNSGSLPKHLHALEREHPVEALVGGRRRIRGADGAAATSRTSRSRSSRRTSLTRSPPTGCCRSGFRTRCTSVSPRPVRSGRGR